jgi:hypothetical protein
VFLAITVGYVTKNARLIAHMAGLIHLRPIAAIY